MTIEEIKTLIAKVSISEKDARDPEKFPGGKHIQLVFQDGELSSQKAGELLWDRSLHCWVSGVRYKALPVELFPQRLRHHGFVFCLEPGAGELCNAIHTYLKSQP